MNQTNQSELSAPLINELHSPFFKELYSHLNQQTYTLDDFEDPGLYDSLQRQLTGDLFRILRPHIAPRPDLRNKYQHADLRVHVYLTPHEVRYCVKPVVVDLSLDLMEESLPEPEETPNPSDKLPF